MFGRGSSKHASCKSLVNRSISMSSLPVALHHSLHPPATFPHTPPPSGLMLFITISPGHPVSCLHTSKSPSASICRQYSMPAIPNFSSPPQTHLSFVACTGARSRTLVDFNLDHGCSIDVITTTGRPAYSYLPAANSQRTSGHLSYR
ncbi:hypothetical protein BAUCODRAFT_332967 [Baudoinia panamericana UAMH 10762]|uniref:Uncharacterized protein n=1 Tax=Baudoinia panamericana (strain UAMH 10762) TaxID=717646 RepID=M2MXN6_BAUPA|nr:uncharacterized protein BAUCODRAFT_332967 [Baudoinia panamericana UAMH 10762]EMC90995.1 hypothetical protein BAUCODRAFT_332967 [Baudoinia panamericana UAMH 10762]